MKIAISLNSRMWKVRWISDSAGLVISLHDDENQTWEFIDNEQNLTARRVQEFNLLQCRNAGCKVYQRTLRT